MYHCSLTQFHRLTKSRQLEIIFYSVINSEIHLRSSKSLHRYFCHNRPLSSLSPNGSGGRSLRSCPSQFSVLSNALQWRRLVRNNIASVYGQLPIRKDAFSERIFVFSVALFLPENQDYSHNSVANRRIFKWRCLGFKKSKDSTVNLKDSKSNSDSLNTWCM